MATEAKHRHFSNFDIAGFSYWDGALVLCDLKPGKKVRLEREEDNKFFEMGYEDIFDARIQRVAI